MEFLVLYDACIDMKAKIEAHISKMHPENKLHRKYKDIITRLDVVLPLVGKPSTRLRDMMPHNRFLAFVGMCYIDLPRDTYKIRPLMGELTALGFEMMTLDVQGVFEPRVTGADFAGS